MYHQSFLWGGRSACDPVFTNDAQAGGSISGTRLRCSASSSISLSAGMSFTFTIVSLRLVVDWRALPLEYLSLRQGFSVHAPAVGAGREDRALRRPDAGV